MINELIVNGFATLSLASFFAHVAWLASWLLEVKSEAHNLSFKTIEFKFESCFFSMTDHDSL